ncbi:hypothetical protein FRB90_008416, partial [Tulasnella sp. 427]
MAGPTDEELISATKDFVRSLKRDGTIEQWTKGLLRERMEKQFKLPAGSLKERRKLVEQATSDVVNESDDEDKDDEPAPPASSKKQKQKQKEESKSPSPKKPANKKKRPSEDVASESEMSVLDDGSPAKPKKSMAKEAKPS